MKRTKDYTIPLLLFIFLVAAITSYPGCYSESKKEVKNKSKK